VGEVKTKRVRSGPLEEGRKYTVLPARGLLKREMQRRTARRNLHPSSRGLVILRNPRGIPIHDPGTMSERLHVDDALPAAAGGVLRVDVGVDERGEDRRSQFEGALEGGLQADAGGRVGRVRSQPELRVWRVLREVE
jgi:hypothetical protein